MTAQTLGQITSFRIVSAGSNSITIAVTASVEGELIYVSSRTSGEYNRLTEGGVIMDPDEPGATHKGTIVSTGVEQTYILTGLNGLVTQYVSVLLAPYGVYETFNADAGVFSAARGSTTSMIDSAFHVRSLGASVPAFVNTAWDGTVAVPGLEIPAQGFPTKRGIMVGNSTSAQNYLLHCNEFNNSAWIKSNIDTETGVRASMIVLASGGTGTIRQATTLSDTWVGFCMGIVGNAGSPTVVRLSLDGGTTWDDITSWLTNDVQYYQRSENVAGTVEVVLEVQGANNEGVGVTFMSVGNNRDMRGPAVTTTTAVTGGGDTRLYATRAETPLLSTEITEYCGMIRFSLLAPVADAPAPGASNLFAITNATSWSASTEGLRAYFQDNGTMDVQVVVNNSGRTQGFSDWLTEMATPLTPYTIKWKYTVAGGLVVWGNTVGPLTIAGTEGGHGADLAQYFMLGSRDYSGVNGGGSNTIVEEFRFVPEALDDSIIAGW